jgi:hypothetical protein
MTARKQSACSGPPKSRSRPYDNRPGSGPGRMPRHAQDQGDIHVILPAEPPRLTPGAARALLRVLVKAHARLKGQDQHEGAAT